MTFEPTAEIARVNARLKELHEKLPGARCVFEPFGDSFRAWKVFARFTWSIDGTTNEETAEKKDYLIVEAPTPTEALARSFRVAEDPKAKLHCLDKLMRGVTDEPPPLTEEEKADEAKMRAKLQLQKERAIEGQRNHLRNLLRRQGLYDVAKKYHKKTGLLPNLFGRMGEVFDFGKR